MPNTYLSKTYSGNGNRNKGTISVWCKFSDAGASADSTIFGAGNTGNDSDCTFLSVNGNGFGNVSTRQIIFALRISGGTVYKAVSNNLLRDVNGWYHIVVRWDTTLGTPNCDIYLNGEEVSYSSNNWSSVSQNTNTYIGGTAQPHYIGRGATNAMQNNYMDGYLSHMHYCDGYYYDASTFGSTDATTGEWKINTSPSVTYGTNGFFLFKDNASTTDQSGQGNNWSVTAGALVDTKDNPSNNFATSNVLDNGADKAPTFGNGNLTHSVGSSVWRFVASTLGAHKGKFYSEIKIHSVSNNVMLGAGDRFDIDNNDMAYNAYPGGEPLGVGYLASNGNSYLNDSGSSYGNSYTANDIIGVAMDIDNGFVYFSKNGVFQNSGDPTSGASGTGGIAFPSTSSATGIKQFMPGLNNANISVNYGGGHFGVTAISTNSGNGYAGVEGDSKFNYQPPTGYAALSTKGLNHF